MNYRKTFYHGTFLKDAEAIKRHGFRISKARGRGVALGPGVYMSAKRSWAMSYVEDVREGDSWDDDGEKGQDAALLHLKIHPDKPLDIDWKRWPEEMLALDERMTGHPPRNPLDYYAIGKAARKLGFDAIVYDQGTTVVFDASKVRAVKIEEFPRDV